MSHVNVNRSVNIFLTNGFGGLKEKFHSGRLSQEQLEKIKAYMIDNAEKLENAHLQGKGILKQPST